MTCYNSGMASKFRVKLDGEATNVEGRPNTRRRDTVTQMAGMVRGSEGKRLRYALPDRPRTRRSAHRDLMGEGFSHYQKMGLDHDKA